MFVARHILGPDSSYDPGPDGAQLRRENGRIVLRTGARADQIRVSRANQGDEDFYEVTVNGERFLFRPEELAKLTLRTGGGDDDVRIDAGVDVPIRVETMGGNDRITNHSHGAILHAGTGRDHITNRASGAQIHAGAGSDRVRSVGHHNTIRAGVGSDQVEVVGDGNTVRGNRGWDAIRVDGNFNDVNGNLGADVIETHGVGNRARGGFGPDVVWATGPGSAAIGGPGWDSVVGPNRFAPFFDLDFPTDLRDLGALPLHRFSLMHPLASPWMVSLL